MPDIIKVDLDNGMTGYIYAPYIPPIFKTFSSKKIIENFCGPKLKDAKNDKTS